MKTIKTAIVVTALLMMVVSIASVSQVFACKDGDNFNLTGVWQFTYGGSYVHTMFITSSYGKAFSGVGFWNPDNSYKWTVTGTVSGKTVKFHILYTGTGAGYFIDAVGTITSSTDMSGTATGTSGSATWSAKKATEVLDVFYLVTRDEDSGFKGYWALDSYLKTAQVWKDPSTPTTFYVIATYDGVWQTFKGALSPQAGVTESKDACGLFNGGYIGTFTDTASYTSKFGFIGVKDYGGTKTDILKGTYGAGQTGPTTPFDFLSTYFPGYASFEQPFWGWTYHYKSQTWNNLASGSSGDIVT